MKIITKVLNQIMNAQRIGKTFCEVQPSKLLIEALKIMKQHNYIDWKEEDGKIRIEICKLNECRVITPRFYVRSGEIEKYIRRFLPSRLIGVILISTSSGLMTHHEALEKGIGGSLIAYCF